MTSLRSIIFGAALLCAPALGFAQGTPEQKTACMDDAFRYCAAQIPDEAAIEACLEKYQPYLTPACRAQFEPAAEPAPSSRKRR